MRAGALRNEVRTHIIVKVSNDSPSHWGGKNPIDAVRRSGMVVGYNSEMIRRARSQVAEVRNNVLWCAAVIRLSCSARAVISGSSVLKMNSGSQPVRVHAAIECG